MAQPPSSLRDENPLPPPLRGGCIFVLACLIYAVGEATRDAESTSESKRVEKREPQTQSWKFESKN